MCARSSTLVFLSTTGILCSRAGNFFGLSLPLVYVELRQCDTKTRKKNFKFSPKFEILLQCCVSVWYERRKIFVKVSLQSFKMKLLSIFVLTVSNINLIKFWTIQSKFRLEWYERVWNRLMNCLTSFVWIFRTLKRILPLIISKKGFSMLLCKTSSNHPFLQKKLLHGIFYSLLLQ